MLDANSAFRPRARNDSTRRFRVETLVVGNRLGTEHAGDHDPIGRVEDLDESILEDVASERPRARLEQRPHASLGMPRAYGAQRFGDGRRVVGEVVEDSDVVRFAAQLETSSDTAKTRKTSGDLIRREPVIRGGGDNGKRVPHVVPPVGRQRCLGERLPGAQDADTGASRALRQHLGAPLAGLEPVTHQAAAGRVAHVTRHGALLVAHDQSPARDEVDQTPECGLDLFEVVIDIGVVELHGSDACTVSGR